MTVDDIKATVRDYTIDKCSQIWTVHIQRYFIREYMTWLPMRFIAESTDAKNHTAVLHSIRCVHSNYNLKETLTALKRILDQKFYGK